MLFSDVREKITIFGIYVLFTLARHSWCYAIIFVHNFHTFVKFSVTVDGNLIIAFITPGTKVQLCALVQIAIGCTRI